MAAADYEVGFYNRFPNVLLYLSCLRLSIDRERADKLSGGLRVITAVCRWPRRTTCSIAWEIPRADSSHFTLAPNGRLLFLERATTTSFRAKPRLPRLLSTRNFREQPGAEEQRGAQRREESCLWQSSILRNSRQRRQCSDCDQIVDSCCWRSPVGCDGPCEKRCW
jgi:hypothetical protein